MFVKRILLEEVPSTNTWAKKHSRNCPPNTLTLVSTKKQTSGRGRFQRKWHSKFFLDLTCSFCFHLPLKHPYILNCCQLMAICIAELLLKHGFDAKVKWPNDLLIHEKKVAGILCELVQESNSVLCIVGVGLNINSESQNLSIVDQKASSLKIESGKYWNVEAMEKELQEIFLDKFLIFYKKGFKIFLEDYKQLCGFDDQLLVLKDRNKSIQGYFHTLNADGSLCLKVEDKKLCSFYSGQVFSQS